MVHEISGSGEGVSPWGLAEKLSEASRQWAETFLRYRFSGEYTDGQAKAMADVEVDLAGARARFEATIALIHAGYSRPVVPDYLIKPQVE